MLLSVDRSANCSSSHQSTSQSINLNESTFEGTDRETIPLVQENKSERAQAQPDQRLMESSGKCIKIFTTRFAHACSYFFELIRAKTIAWCQKTKISLSRLLKRPTDRPGSNSRKLTIVTNALLREFPATATMYLSVTRVGGRILKISPITSHVSFNSLLAQVPALATKDFALRFLAFKEGVTAATVTFTNDHTEEYIFHCLRITTTQSGVQASNLVFADEINMF